MINAEGSFSQFVTGALAPLVAKYAEFSVLVQPDIQNPQQSKLRKDVVLPVIDVFSDPDSHEICIQVAGLLQSTEAVPNPAEHTLTLKRFYEKIIGQDMNLEDLSPVMTEVSHTDGENVYCLDIAIHTIDMRANEAEMIFYFEFGSFEEGN